MAVTFVGPSGRSAKNSAGKRTYTRKFKLTTSDQADTEYDVGSDPNLPVIGSVHPSDALAVCTEIQVDNTDPWRGWTVTCTYTNERDITNNPDSDEVLISFSNEAYEEVVLTDEVTGNAILNTAADPFSEPPTREASHLIAHIKFSTTSVPSWILSYQNSVNSDNITIGGLAVSAGQAKMQNLNVGEREYRSGVAFYTVTYQIKIKSGGWKYQPLSAGFNQLLEYKDETTGIISLRKYDCYNNGDQKPVSEPALLDADGVQIGSNNPTDGYFMSFDIYPTATFASLPGVS
jgi:hypothetical protein